jgi:hypothetical protein
MDGNALGRVLFGFVISHPKQANQMARGMGLVAVL